MSKDIGQDKFQFRELFSELVKTGNKSGNMTAAKSRAQEGLASALPDLAGY